MILLTLLFVKTIAQIYATYLDYLLFVILLPIVFLLDILLLPLEIIARILFRIFEGEW